MTFVTTLDPPGLWSHFDTILTIPRGSKNEAQMRQMVVRVATEAGLEHAIDDAGNVVVRKPGTSGHETAATTILQSHLDMVNEKNSDHRHDFLEDPIVPQRSGFANRKTWSEWIRKTIELRDPDVPFVDQFTTKW